jgi:ATP-dependent Clp protease ATP-binding subunit ClpA
MFERYTESARRALFFGRYEAAQLGGLAIEPEHVLLGVLRDAPLTITRFATKGSAESIRRVLQDAYEPHEKVSTSVEIPFSRETKAALEGALVEADFLKNRWIGPAHLVLGIMVKTSGAAAHALDDAGLDADALREYLRSTPETERDWSAGGSSATADISARLAPGAVCREWKGVVKPDRASDYLLHLRQETLPALARLPGFVSMSIFRRQLEDGAEFQVMTVWRWLGAIEAFAGPDITLAVVPPAAQAMMVRFDARAVHYEVVL